MKNHIGIYFTSKHGQTQKIANHIAQLFRQELSEVDLVDLAERRNLSLSNILGVDAVMIGAPVYAHSYPREVAQFVRKNREALLQIPTTAFFSVCLAATPQTEEAYEESLGPARHLLDNVGWNPHWIASFPGALNYLEYNPLVRWIMQNISKKEGGPTDTHHDYDMTRWNEVAEFADHFFQDVPGSRYRGSAVPHATRTLNELMPKFEARIVQQTEIAATPEDIRAAIETMELEDMPVANLLASIRNFGRKTPGYAPHVSFHDSAEAFGSLNIESNQKYEIVGALVGQFWKRDYGIRRMQSFRDFRNFAHMDYTKVLTNFYFGEVHNGKTVVRTESRMHSMSCAAEHKFRRYWFVVGLGVRLYMRSVLHGIARSAHRRTWQHPVAAA